MRDWLKSARLKRGLTMKKLSEMLGISESYYCLVESGDRQKIMDLSLAEHIAAALQIPITKIIEEEAQLRG